MQRSLAGTSIWDDGNAKLDRSQSLPGTEATAVYVSLVEPTEADREIERQSAVVESYRAKQEYQRKVIASTSEAIAQAEAEVEQLSRANARLTGGLANASKQMATAVNQQVRLCVCRVVCAARGAGVLLHTSCRSFWAGEGWVDVWHSSMEVLGAGGGPLNLLPLRRSA